MIFFLMQLVGVGMGGDASGRGSLTMLLGSCLEEMSVSRLWSSWGEWKHDVQMSEEWRRGEVKGLKGGEEACVEMSLSLEVSSGGS
jgi:hypothetical protein